MTSVIHLATDVTTVDRDRFIELPFDVPRGAHKIRVQISVTPHGKEPCIIDVGLCDPIRVRGWSGSTKYDLTVGVDEATPGYLKGDITAGKWAILLGVYVVGKNGAHVDVSVTLSEAKHQWLQGDLHVHTVHSDGAYTLAELDAIAQRSGMDFIGLTDHNTISQNNSFPKESPVTYIPAMELTTYHGHVNLFGVTNPCDDFRVQKTSDVVELLKQAKSRGAFVSINHPFDDAGPSCQWQWGYEVPFDWIEVWNGPWRPSNLESLMLWQSMLTEGKRIIAVGGSDAHGPHAYVRHGYPTTNVYSSSREMTDILSGIRAGHVSLSYCPNGPRIELVCGDAVMGDEVSLQDPTHVHIESVKPKDVVVIISDAGEFERHEVIQSGVWNMEVEHTTQRFIRVELWRYFQETECMLLVSLSNPIFFSRT